MPYDGKDRGNAENLDSSLGIIVFCCEGIEFGGGKNGGEKGVTGSRYGGVQTLSLYEFGRESSKVGPKITAKRSIVEPFDLSNSVEVFIFRMV